MGISLAIAILPYTAVVRFFLNTGIVLSSLQVQVLMQRDNVWLYSLLSAPFWESAFVDTPPDKSGRFSGYACGTPRRWRLTGQPGPTVRWSVRRGSVERPYKYPFSHRGEKPASREGHSSPGSSRGAFWPA